jgi:hypothetical protein
MKLSKMQPVKIPQNDQLGIHEEYFFVGSIETNQPNYDSFLNKLI